MYKLHIKINFFQKSGTKCHKTPKETHTTHQKTRTRKTKK